MTQNKPFIMDVATEFTLPQPLLDLASTKLNPTKARYCAMANSVGGIGPLMRDRLFGQSDRGLDVVGVSLLYEFVWVQTWENGQIKLVKEAVGDDLRQVLQNTGLKFQLSLFNNDTVDVEVWRAFYGTTPGYFLSCPSVTGVVYPSPVDAPEGTEDPGYWAHERRLKQQWILGRGVLHLAKALKRKPSLIVLSETPTIFSHHKLFQGPFQTDPHFEQTQYIFNDHTPMEYAHPLWDEPTQKLVQLDPAVYKDSPCWNEETKHVDLTCLAAEHCAGVFGVAQKHKMIMKEMSSMKPFADKIEAITNGVRPEQWQASELQSDLPYSEKTLMLIKDDRRKALIDWLQKNTQVPPDWADTAAAKKLILLTRRITPYKRLDVLNHLLDNDELKAQFLKLNCVLLVGGRIHQQDEQGYQFAAELIEKITKDSDLTGRLIFIENFNIWEAPLLYQGCDAALMLSDEAKEASATGFMKAQMNGAVVVATSDGAVPEFVNFAGINGKAEVNGFQIPYKEGEPTAQGLLRALAQFDDAFNHPKKRYHMMKASLAKTPSLSIERTVKEMEKLYDKVLTQAVHR